MKFIYMLLWGMIFSSHCFAAKADTKDLKKNSAQGFIVPYVLRYDPKEWSCTHKSDGQELNCPRRLLEIILSANKEEKNIEREELDRCFAEAVKVRFSNTENYGKVDIKPSKIVTINGIIFLHQSAIVHLLPNSVQITSNGGRGFNWRNVSADGGQDQLDYYIYTGDNGRVSFHIESLGLISQEDQAVIDELFRGFSFDGSACRGPSKLRTLKTIFEVITKQ